MDTNSGINGVQLLTDCLSDCLSFKLLSTGWEVLKRKFSSPQKGVEGISRKKLDGDASSQRQKNMENGYEVVVPAFPEGTSVDPATLSSQNNGDDTVKSTTANMPKDTSNGENKHERLDALKSRNSLNSTATMIPQELANASPQIKLMAIMMARINRSKSDMDKYLDLILESNKKNEELSKIINDESQKAVTSKKDASLKESSASKWEAWGKIIGTGIVLAATTVIGMLSPSAVNMDGATGLVTNVISLVKRIFTRENIPSFENAGNIVQGIANSTASKYREKGAMDTLESDLGQVKVQDKKDEQSRNSTEISVLQNLFSNSSQEYNTSLGILQTMISSENEAKRTVASNLR
ncbi:MAG: hypothetical protein LBQ23_01065 [Puniceicoccales bacterium]|jgi:hypothetical protein|nr:hypothetical protein [Puniceicoccales bacterium]